MMTLDQMTDDTFRPLREQVFHVTASSGQRMDVSLIEVNSATHQGAGRQQFSLIFRGPGDPVWPQGIYCVENDALGKLDIFLVPVARTSDHVDYEAVFA
jgi:hypothetical protein